METENLIPRLLLVGGLTAVLVIYTRQRQNRLQEVAATASSVAPGVASDATEAAASIVGRGQHMIENLLDNVADQALKELKTVLKDGIKRLEHLVDEL